MRRSKTRRPWLFLLAGALICAGLTPFAAAQGRRGGSGDRWPRLEVGAQAPDFELPVLRFETGKDGTIVGKVGKEKIKLSKFRGKQAVVVFFSSYT